MNTRSFLVSVGLGGLTIALLSNLPFISIGNCLLCLWVWGGAIFSVFLYRQFSKENPSLSVGQGAALGALAGLVGAILGTIFSFFFTQAGLAAALAFLDSQPQLAEQLGGLQDILLSAGGFSILSALCNSVFYIGFGAIGGLIGTAAIWKPTSTSITGPM